MRQPLRKVHYLLLALVLLGQATGYWLGLRRQQQFIRQEAEAALLCGGEESLMVLRIAPGDEPPRRVGRRDIRHDGKLYDVLRTEQRGDTLIYYCRYDEAENEWFEALGLRLGAGAEPVSLPKLTWLPPLPALLTPPAPLPGAPGARGVDPPAWFPAFFSSPGKPPPAPPPERTRALYI